jgi:branched-chain amino acid transport system permease protein
MNGFVIGSIYALMALGFTIVFGIMGVINFAHGELYMIGAFLAFYMTTLFHLPYLACIGISIILTALIGAVLEVIGFRPLRGAHISTTMMSSLALSLILQNICMTVWGAEQRPFIIALSKINLVFWGLHVSLHRLLIIGVVTVLIIISTFIIQKTRLGRAMRACAQDLEAATWMGVNINTIASFTFSFSAGIAAAAGALITPLFIIDPFVGVAAIFKSFTVVIIGGLGSVPGAIISGLFLGILETLVAGYINADYVDTVSFSVLIAFLIFRPSGILGTTAEQKI